MLVTAILLSATRPVCPVSVQLIVISASPVEGEALGGRRDRTQTGPYRVGDFLYVGNGIVERSADPRFRDLVLDQRTGLRYRCGNAVTGPSGWNARDPNLSRWTMTIGPVPASTAPSPGSTAAWERGARPVMDGYVVAATWPVFFGSGNFYMGLMHPAGGATHTLIVAFRDDPQPTPAVVMANIPIVFDMLSLTPDLHGPDIYVNFGSMHGGKLTNVILRLDRQTMASIYAKLALGRTSGQ